MSIRAGLRTAFLTGCLLSPVLAASPGARADTVTPDQAHQLEGQIRQWLAALAGPSMPIGDHPIKVTPEGDHYRLSVELAGNYGDQVKVTVDPLTALVKPIDGTRWAIDDMHLPSPIRVENTGSGKDMFKSWSGKIADQSSKGIFDPTLATTSNLDTTLRGYTAITEGATGTKTSHVDRQVSHSTWQPAGDGRVNMVVESTGDHLTTDAATPDGDPLKVTVDTFKLNAHADKVSFNRIGEMIHTGFMLAPMIQAANESSKGKDSGDGKPMLSDASKKLLHAVVAAAQDSLAGLEETLTMDKLAFQSKQFNGSVAHSVFGFGFAAPDGRADMHMLWAMDGLASPMIPPGVIANYVPKHISLRPRVSGIPMAELVAFLNHAIDSQGGDSDALEAEAMGLLAKGPLSVGIDDLSLDAGPATLKGSGTVSISSPADYSSQSTLRMTGFDKLIQQANTTPELKQAAPVMIFLKGIGKQEGDAMVWNITFQDKKLLVNGTDLSAMMPQDKQ